MYSSSRLGVPPWGTGNGFLHSIAHFLLVVDVPMGADAAGGESSDQI